MAEQKDKSRRLYIDTGGFGATYMMVKWALARFKTIYATTERKVIETHDGDKVSSKKIFEHVRFRFYENN